MSIFYAVFIVAAFFAASVLAFWVGKRTSRSSATSVTGADAPSGPKEAGALSTGTISAHTNAIQGSSKLEYFSILDQSGTVVVQSNEIVGIPTYARRLPPENPSVQQAAQLAADLFKGAVSLPNRSINIVFRPEVQAGLKDGTYTLMKTTAGETLADAVDAGSKIVAKGRIVETGKLRQLASGGFQLASIVVAQAHLADIERSLNAIRKDVGIILEELEATNRAEITGKISFLSSLIDHVRQSKCAGELPSHFANSIQHVVLESHVLRDKLYEDMKALIRRVEQQNDPDTFGTEGVYKALRTHVDKADNLLNRHGKLVQLMTVLNYAVTYIDPTAKQFFRADMDTRLWNQLSKELEGHMRAKAQLFLSKASFNSDDTLLLRKKDIIRDTDAFSKKSGEQQTAFDDAMHALTQDNNRYFSRDSETHIALSFDSHGSVREAAVL